MAPATRAGEDGKANLPESGNVRIEAVAAASGTRGACARRSSHRAGHHQVIEKPITPGLRGQLKQVRHLIEVSVIDGQTKSKSKPKPKAKPKAKAEGEAK